MNDNEDSKIKKDGKNLESNQEENNETLPNKETISEIESLKNELSEEKSRRLTLMADFQNYKKRMEQERSTFGAIANMGLIQELLEVSDDLGMALMDENLDLEGSKTSIKSAQDKLVAAAKRAGVEKIEIKVGEEFNKEIMEAVSTIPDDKNKGKVIAVISSAYKYTGQDTILRHAKVIVGK